MKVNDTIIINGPNLNLLGKREKNIYGKATLQSIMNNCLNIANENNINLSFFQSNHEGDLIDTIQESVNRNIKNIIINPGAFTHTSYAIVDALIYAKEHNIKIYEVHLSNIYAREEFRNKSLVSPVANAVISGLGERGYYVALYML